jgi:hypothetical protein
VIFLCIVTLFLSNLTDTDAQYIENKTQLTEKGENYSICEKKNGTSNFDMAALQQGETINTDIFGCGDYCK